MQNHALANVPCTHGGLHSARSVVLFVAVILVVMEVVVPGRGGPRVPGRYRPGCLGCLGRGDRGIFGVGTYMSIDLKVLVLAFI